MGISPETVRQAALELDPEAEVTRRFGARVARKKHGIFGRSRPADAPLGKVYIDHTQLDVHVAYEDENGHISYAGRPHITLVVDDHSGMPLGFALSFDRPKVAEVLGAIRHAILPKGYTAQWVGQGLTAEWEAMGFFGELWGDNGLEIVARDVFSSLFALGISNLNTPIKEPMAKGRMERMFGTFNTKLLHRLTGTTFGRSDLRDLEYDGRTYACILFADLWKLLHVVIEEIATSWNEGLEDIPLRRWREGVRRFPVELPVDMLQFDADLSMRFTRTIQRQGIEFEGRYYAGENLVDLKRRTPGTSRYTICVCPDDLNHIFVLDPKDGHPIELPCTIRSDHPVTLAEHRLARRLRREGRHPDEAARKASAARNKVIQDADAASVARRAAEINPQKLALDARRETSASRPKPAANAAREAAKQMLAASQTGHKPDAPNGEA